MNRGLSLIELVAAMAIFALIAVMGVQGLSGTLRVRDALGARLDRAEEIAVPAALLRADLEAMVPLIFYPPEGARPRSSVWLGADGTRLALSRGGMSALTPDGAVRAGDLGRVVWSLDRATGTLSRQSWPVLAPASAAQASPAVRVLDGVAALRVRTHWGALGWQAGVRNMAGAAPVPSNDDTGVGLSFYSDALPRAIEVTVVLQDGRELPIVEALQ